MTEIDSIQDGKELIYPKDRPAKFANLGYRCIYTFLAWVVLGEGILPDLKLFPK